MRDAQFLADELQLINETGNSLATRLENLAERGRKSLEISDEHLGENVSSISKRRGSAAQEDDGFMIHDHDFDDGLDDDAFLADGDAEMGKLSSAAEKELYQALKKNKK